MTIKTLRHQVLITLLTLGALFGVVVIAVFYLGEHFIDVTEMRTTSVPKTVKVRWYLSCEKEYYEDENERHYDPQVPIGGLLPGVRPIMSSNTEFVLVGYPYKELRRNIFTGTVIEQRSKRLDVIEWHVVTPYITLKGEEYIESNKPLEWKSDKTAPQFFTQLGRSHKGGC